MTILGYFLFNKSINSLFNESIKSTLISCSWPSLIMSWKTTLFHLLCEWPWRITQWFRLANHKDTRSGSFSLIRRWHFFFAWNRYWIRKTLATVCSERQSMDIQSIFDTSWCLNFKSTIAAGPSSGDDMKRIQGTPMQLSASTCTTYYPRRVFLWIVLHRAWPLIPKIQPVQIRPQYLYSTTYTITPHSSLSMCSLFANDICSLLVSCGRWFKWINVKNHCGVYSRART